MTRLDRWLVVALTPLVAAGLAWGAVRTDPARREGSRRFTAAGDVAAEETPPPREGWNPFAPKPQADLVTDPLASLRILAEEGSTLVPWDRLKAYEYRPGLAGLPEDIRALDGKTVTMAGFLLPVYEFEDIHEFALVGNHWSCCFGQPPTLNGVVTVRLPASEVGLPNTAEPLRVVGTFHVKETKESGWVVSIFTIDPARVSILKY